MIDFENIKSYKRVLALPDMHLLAAHSSFQSAPRSLFPAPELHKAAPELAPPRRRGQDRHLVEELHLRIPILLLELAVVGAVVLFVNETSHENELY